MTKKEYEYILIESHVDQIRLVVKSFLKRGNYKYDYLEEDMLSLGNEILVLSAKRFDPKRNKVKFKTYFYNIFKNRLQNLIRNDNKYKKNVVNVDDFDKIYNSLVVDDEEVDTGVLSALSEVLTDAEMSIVNQNLTGTLTNKEMANELSMNHSTFRDVKRRLKKKISQIVIETELFKIKEGDICLK